MSYLTFNTGAAPTTPAAGKLSVYVDSADRYLKTLDEKGVIGQPGDHELLNFIRNSGFWFAQRQTPASAVTYSSTTGRAICADGWGITNENASATHQRTDALTPETGLQGRFYGNFIKITSNGKLIVSQVLEGIDTGGIRSRTVRVQGWMKQLVGAGPVIRLGLIQLAAAGTVDTIPAAFISAMNAAGTDPTLGTNLAYIAPRAGVTGDNCTANGNAYDCTLSASWQRFGGVFDIPANSKNVIVAFWSNALLTATNGFALSQVSLTDGYEIQNWSPLDFNNEWDRCRRFYQKSFLVDTAPVQNAGVNTGERRGVAGKAGAVANAGFIPIQYEVAMRATPTTVVVYNPAAANALGRDITGTADLGATTITGSSANNFYTNSTGVAATAVGDLIAIHFSADAEL
jgi:hypothetical protein